MSFSAKNSRTGFELQTTYKVNDQNTVVMGGTYEYMKQYDVRTRANTLATSSLYLSIPLPRVMNITIIQNYNRPVSRNFKAFFIEDLWDITKTVRLTTGGRYRLKVKNKAFWTAILAIVGCAVMLFNWIAVNFIIVGLHSYA